MSLPSGVSTASSFSPATRSGAPHSSTFRCAVEAQIAASYGRVSACSATTFAPVPLNTSAARASSPKCVRNSSPTRAVQSSPPYETAWPVLAAAIASSTSGRTPA